jgi:Asp-tRNA(Asn)/Glu-tRNA(Gln) amidotransferase A subunit family amidase
LFAGSIADTIRGREHDAMPMTLVWTKTVTDDPTTFAEGLEIEGRIWDELGRVFARFDVLLCPTMCIGALEAGIDYCAEPLFVDGVEWDAMHDICLAEAFNPAGTCPVLNVPIGRDEHDVPLGVQIVTRPYDDHTAFRVGARLELDQPWPQVATVV